MSRHDQLFNARGIAIIGASDDPSRPGSQPIAALKRTGYKGGVYPVNPRYAEVGGYRCYATPADIKGDVDIAVIALPAAGAVDMVKICGERGIPYGVVLGGGFREVGEAGLALQNSLVANARAHGMRLIGPNCNGIANIHSHMYACFGSMSRTPLLQPGPVSVVMQSGGFGYGMALSCRNAGIGFRMLIASGNEADLSAPELIDLLIDDPETKVILAYLEGVMDGRALMNVGEKALKAGKPILIWKAGKTTQGVRVAATHTANMTGTYDIWRAAFRQCGIVDVYELEQVTDFIQAFNAGRFPRGRNIAVLSPSGGSAVVVSDAADEFGLHLPALGAGTAAILESALPHAHSRVNPIDLGAGGISPSNRASFDVALNALLDDPEIHQICLMTPTSIGDRAIAGADALSEAVKRTDKPIFVFSTLLRDVIPEVLDRFAAAKIPVLHSPVRVARAAGLLADYAEIRNGQASRMEGIKQSGKMRPVVAIPEGATGVLDEAQSKALLAAVGIRVSKDLILTGEKEQAAQLSEVNFPVAVKILSADIAHKTDIGGVVLNVSNQQELEVAIDRVRANARSRAPNARIDGVLVSEMITDAIELIVGIVNDSVFGPVVMLGMGGVYAEVLKDVTYRPAPIGVGEATEMIQQLRSFSILEGVRGKPASDIEALAQVIALVSQMGWAQRDRLLGMDINPMMVLPKGRGVIAADALIVLR